MGRLIDPIELKRSIAVSNMLGDGKTLEELIDEQPDAQPQSMRGRWDFIGWNQYACTACRHQFYSEWLEGWATYTNEPPFPNFCPNCGAQME